MNLIQKYKEGALTTGDIRKLNHLVICLMVLVGIFSIVWSVSLHMLSGDFTDGIISAKIIFKDRNFQQMNNISKELLSKDLQNLGQISYELNTKSEALQSESQTKKPKYKVAHIFESRENAPFLARLVSQQQHNEKEATATTTTVEPPKILLNADADRKFLATQVVDTHATRWSRGFGAEFVYTFPLISEIVSIIWTAMCLIYQTGNKSTSVLPKPWRIVVPSIVIFTLMSLGSVAYTIVTNGYLKRLCGDLRQSLTNPFAISCGDAIALLRPLVHKHSVSHDSYLDLFRFSYVICTILWLLALLVMVLRYMFAVDFQLVDIEDMFERDKVDSHTFQPGYIEVKESSPQRRQQMRPKSEDDYQSAKSRLSDMAAPLLEQKLQEQEQQEQQQQQQTHLTIIG